MPTTLSFVDCLAHLDDSRVEHREEFLLRASEAGAVGVINAGVDPCNESWQWSTTMKEPPVVYRAFGIHPLAVGRLPFDTHLNALKRRLGQGSAVAIGEIGLDRRKGMPEINAQKLMLNAQLDLAEELRLPVILHCVRAHDQMVHLLRSRPHFLGRGWVHGFTGSWEVAQDYLSCGLSLSFGGLVTRPNSKKAKDVVKRVPLERLLLESDTPDHPASGWEGAQSEPAAIPLIIEYIAQLRGESREEISQSITQNALGLLGLTSEG